ncbi:hypothetical protein EKO27_g5005 [Xylaria grammica]|uniref:CPAF-like PDZ domain-containing protein n=1 Tax=Xylaria grammica TaxID=363999 RepID=A0A439D6S4_9PEZI|nr:hypothetical protein EKO27_g5005 [Xylaria grammica]
MKSFTLSAVALAALLSAVAPASAAVASRNSNGKSCGGSRPTNGTTTAAPTPTATEPCVVARDAFISQTSASPGVTPTMAASLAYDCLKSVPAHKEPAIQLLDALKPFLEWQSDQAVLKDPPSDYPYPPVDIFGELENIRSNLEADKYSGELEWQEELFKTITGKPHDGHLAYYPDLLTVPFEWVRPWTLVSVSEDGTSLPVVKVLEDVVSPGEESSYVTEINGVDAATFIEERVTDSSNTQDPDAGYNTMFFSQANKAGLQANGYFEGGGRERFFYPGNVTVLTFANGTTVSKPNIAKFHYGPYDWHNVKDADTMHKEFCRGAYPIESSRPSIRDVKSTRRTAAPKNIHSYPQPPVSLARRQDEPNKIDGYPEPVLISDDQIVSGYFIDEPGFEDVAVLVMLSFSPYDFVAFQTAVQDFFAEAVEAGKTKLIIDVQANGGGTILQGYDTFRQIFPDIVQAGPSRWRSSPGFNALSETLSPICSNYTPKADDYQNLDIPCTTVNNWRNDLNETNGRFTSYADKFGPLTSGGDSYTNYMEWDPANPVLTRQAFGTDITGYGRRTNFTRPFGGPENIVLLYDGYCASTCSIFSQFMRHGAGVKSIAMGGRPQEGPIQGVGGVKGSQVYPFRQMSALAELALEYTEDPAIVKELQRLDATLVSSRSPFQVPTVNVRDAVLPNELESGIPTQFVTELADCRLYWTELMVQNTGEIWKAAAQAAFKGGKCAAGGIEQPLKRPQVTASKSHGYRRQPQPVRSGQVLSPDSLIMQHLRVQVSD